MTDLPDAGELAWFGLFDNGPFWEFDNGRLFGIALGGMDLAKSHTPSLSIDVRQVREGVVRPSKYVVVPGEG